MVVDFDKVTLEDYTDNYFDLKFSLEDIFGREVDLLTRSDCSDIKQWFAGF